jgi:hypothetical protein
MGTSWITGSTFTRCPSAESFRPGSVPESGEDLPTYFGGIAHAPARDVDDLFCDDFREKVVAICKA